MAEAIPVEVSDLTPERLSAALAEGGVVDAEVASVSSHQIGEGVGFIGQIHRLELDYSSGGDRAPSSMIAKMPTNDPGGRMIGQMLRLYEKESGFYANLASDCPVTTAACYYNGVDAEAGSWCLLMEDLDGLTPGDQLNPRGHDEMLHDLSLMARIHATWSDGRADHHQWLPAMDDPSTAGMVAMFDDAFPVTMERYGHAIPTYMHDWGPRFAPTAMDWVTDFASQPGTIVHGDFRTDNFMFDADGATTVIDWQLTSRAPGAYDLYYYLALSADPVVVHDHFDSILAHYRSECVAAGGSTPEIDELMTQLRGCGLWLTTLGVVTMSQLDPANERGEALFLTMWDRGIKLAERIDLTPELP